MTDRKVCPRCGHPHCDKTGELGCWACGCGHPSDCECAGCADVKGNLDYMESCGRLAGAVEHLPAIIPFKSEKEMRATVAHLQEIRASASTMLHSLFDALVWPNSFEEVEKVKEK